MDYFKVWHEECIINKTRFTKKEIAQQKNLFIRNSLEGKEIDYNPNLKEWRFVMLKKNEFTIGVLALLLSIGLAGSAFASDRSYIELDESDYNEIYGDFDTNAAVNAEVVQNETQVPTIAGWVNLIELDESDYSEGQYGFYANQTDRPAQVAVAQTSTSASFDNGWVNLIELDESDYEYATPGNTSKRVLCAGTGSTGQMNGC